LTERSWCEVCQFEATADTIKELMKIWFDHIATPKHQNNVIKFLQYDLGAMAVDQIPEKLEAFFDN